MKSLFRQFPDPQQQMAGRNPLLDRHIGQQGAPTLLLTSHQRLSINSNIAELAEFFSKLLSATGS